MDKYKTETVINTIKQIILLCDGILEEHDEKFSPDYVDRHMLSPEDSRRISNYANIIHLILYPQEKENE